MVAAALENPLDLFAPAFAQRALLAVVLLAVVSAAIGWVIVLRELAFFTHSIGAGAYPALVLGAIAGAASGISAIVGALTFALLLAGLLLLAKATDERRRDAVVGLAVAAALAAGAVIASGQAAGGGLLGSPESLLFGSVLTLSGQTLLTLALAAAVVCVLTALLFSRWLAAGFDPGFASSRAPELLLYSAVALASGAALPVTGALLAGAILIIPAACVRMFASRAWQLPPWTFAFAALFGVSGLYLALAFDLPPGATIAALAGAGFFVAAGVKAGSARMPAPAVASILLVSLVLAGCGQSSSPDTDPDARLEVVATTPQVADIVRSVGGDAVEVVSLLPVGADPHEYEVRPRAVAALERADIVFRSGGDIDAWAEEAIEAAARTSPPVDLSRAAVLIENPAAKDGAQPAPASSHWYLAPANVARAARRVRDELVKADPSARETFRANADEYLTQLDALTARLIACSGKLPRAERRLMASHDDLTYLADAFGFEIVAQLGNAGDAGPSASTLQAAVDAGRKGGARALVASSGHVSQLDRQVAKTLGIPLLALYTDNLTTGDDASTLLDAIDYDVDRIVDAVTGGATGCAGRS